MSTKSKFSDLVRLNRPEMYSDELQIQGFVTLRQGDEIILDNVQNRWTMAGLTHFASALLGFRVTGGSTNSNLYTATLFFGMGGITQPSYIAAGSSDVATTTATTAITSAIASHAIVGSPVLFSNDLQRYIFTVTASWSSNTLSKQINEFGLFGRPFNNMGGGWSENYASSTVNTNHDKGIALLARISVGDGSFAPIAIDTTMPYSMDWVVML